MFGRTTNRGGGPSAVHPFVAPEDPRSGLAVASAHQGLAQSAALAVTDASMREPGCAVKGCGKPRHDPIHEAQE